MEDLTCSKGANPGTHILRDMEKYTDISPLSVWRMIKTKGWTQFKCLKIENAMNEWRHRKKRTEKDGVLDEQFVQNFRSIEKYVWQDEKNCTFEVPFN